MATDKQKRAIIFCEEVLKINFDGNIEDDNQVNSFLSEHFEKAKKVNQMNIDDASFSIFEIY